MTKGKAAENVCMELRTVQANAFKVLIEALKELLTDTAIEVSEQGLKITTMSTSRVVLVHLKLEAENFEYFHCDGVKILGVNMINLYKIIKTVNSNDTLSLYMTNDNLNQLCVRIDKDDKGTSSVFHLNLLDIRYENFNIPPADFASVITLPSNDLQKICRDMNNIADEIDITKVGNTLILKCKGDFCSQETVITDNHSMEDDESGEQSDEIIQGVYNLKYMCMFTKCTNLSNTVEIYMKNDYPMIVKYTVASLGTIKLCVCPILHDDAHSDM